jgi:hypothetical protein
MIIIKELKTIEDFKNIKKGDHLACEFNRDVHDFPKTYRFNVFKVSENKERTKEIILQKKNNIYFNYEMFVNGESNLESCFLIKQEPNK